MLQGGVLVDTTISMASLPPFKFGLDASHFHHLYLVSMGPPLTAGREKVLFLPAPRNGPTGSLARPVYTGSLGLGTLPLLLLPL